MFIVMLIMSCVGRSRLIPSARDRRGGRRQFTGDAFRNVLATPASLCGLNVRPCQYGGLGGAPRFSLERQRISGRHSLFLLTPREGFVLLLLVLLLRLRVPPLG